MFRVYVGNLPYAVRDGDLKDFFEKAGCSVTEATVVMMPDGRSKGFGFVSLENEDSFKKAQALSGSDMQGRQVRIDAARPKEDRGNGGDTAMAKPMSDEKSDKMDNKADATMNEAPAETEVDLDAKPDDKTEESDDDKDDDASDDEDDKEDK